MNNFMHPKSLLITLSFSLFAIYGSAQRTKITNYNLGSLYEKVKNTEYYDYKGNCQGYVNNVMFDYVIQFFNEDNKNYNTLKKQIKNQTLRQEYETNVEKIISNYKKRLDYYFSSQEDCPQKRFVLFKNHLTAYEMLSKYYCELDNIETERYNQNFSALQKHKLDSINIIQSKRQEITGRLAKLSEEKELLSLGTADTPELYNLENKLSALDIALEKNLARMEQDQTSQIKKLPPTNFKANKAKIQSDFRSKINALKQKYNTEKSLLESAYRNEQLKINSKTQPEIDKIDAEMSSLENFDYDTIAPNFENTDDGNFKVRREELYQKFRDEWKALFTNIDTLYNSTILGKT